MKNTTTVLITLLFMIVPFHLFAQDKSPIKLGLKVAPNIAWMSPSTTSYVNDGIRFGATIGFVSDFYFSENYALASGFNFQFLNGGLNYSDSIFTSGAMKDGQVSRKYNLLYFEIPLTVKMKTKKFGNIAYFGQIGLGTGFNIKSTVNEDFEPTDGSKAIQQTYTNATTLIRESIIIGFGGELSIDESSRILLGLTYSNGLNNILKGVNNKSGLEAKSLINYVELNIGFLF